MFREDLKQYGNSSTHYFDTPTSDTLEITKAALKVLQEIYREGIYYKKSGVIVSHMCDNSAIQQNLFDDITNRKERNELMKASLFVEPSLSSIKNKLIRYVTHNSI